MPQLRITLNEQAYARVLEIAQEERRTPTEQAAYMLEYLTRLEDDYDQDEEYKNLREITFHIPKETYNTLSLVARAERRSPQAQSAFLVERFVEHLLVAEEDDESQVPQSTMYGDSFTVVSGGPTGPPE